MESIIDQWSYFLKEASALDHIPEALAMVSPIKQAFELANQQMWNKEDSDTYDYLYKNRAIELVTQKELLQNAKKQGIEQGIEQGETRKALEIAKNLLAQGLDLQTISNVTGLSEQQIQSLLSN